MNVSEFTEKLSFTLDDFQIEAMRNIADGHSVVVCAPTGSGKTIIAEYAATRAIGEGKKLFYTTPLKALSNQKYHDLKAMFGDANVGLLTGDTSVNRDARIVVMTTEIFRNMLYGIHEDSGMLGHIGYVVLDECHFMNDAERGTVWEESIIYCPDSIQLIALSATVANAQELTDWINEVHHDTRLIWSDFRPVPLRFSYYDREMLMPLFEGQGKSQTLNKKLKLDQKGNRFSKDRRFFRPNLLINLMQEKDMLPAIFFTFSRKDCDKHLEFTQNLKLLRPDERKLINEKIDEFLTLHPFLENNAQIPFIRNGFASHHAGLLPALKHLVEILFQQGLIKAVFATETLAAGINMPARSTVITKISKRTNDGHRILTASEFLQMSGRAGRRGMDKVGYVIIVSSQYEGAREAATLASAPPDPLNSQFTPTYGMVLNLLQKNTLEQSEYLIRQSFGQFTAARRLKPLLESVQSTEAKLKEALEFTCPYGVSDKDFHAFLKSRTFMYETSRFVRILQKQVKQHGESPEILQQLAHEQGKLDNLRNTVGAVACKSCPIIKKHETVEERIQRYQKKLKMLNRTMGQEHDTYWRQFMNIYGLLKEAQYIGADEQPTLKGELTARIRAENEFAIAELILSEENILADLTPPQLAGVMCAIVNDSTRENLFSRISLSPQVDRVLDDIDKLWRRIDRLQKKHHVYMQLVLNPICSPLVEAWAQGMSWEKLATKTNIGEGDLVRVMRRTVDILRQIGRIDEVPMEIRLKAKEALKMMYREPIKDAEAVEIEAEEAQGETQKPQLTVVPPAETPAPDRPFPVNHTGEAMPLQEPSETASDE